METRRRWYRYHRRRHIRRASSLRFFSSDACSTLTSDGETAEKPSTQPQPSSSSAHAAAAAARRWERDPWERPLALEKLWSRSDDIELLQGLIDLGKQRGAHPSEPALRCCCILNFVEKNMQGRRRRRPRSVFRWLCDKMWALTKTYRIWKELADCNQLDFSDSQERLLYELSDEIWGKVYFP